MTTLRDVLDGGAFQMRTKDGKNPRATMVPPSDYEPHLFPISPAEKRDFDGDQAMVHRNSTYFDDDGYDVFHLDRDGKLRPDLAPQCDGRFVLALLAAVQRAIEMASGLAVEVCGEDHNISFYSVNLGWWVAEAYTIDEICENYDLDQDLSEIDGVPWGLEPRYGTFGLQPFGLFDDIIDMPAYEFLTSYSFWDYETGCSPLDTSDFAHALSQIGERMRVEAIELGDLLDRSAAEWDVYNYPAMKAGVATLKRASDLLMTESLWDDGMEAWARVGAHNDDWAQHIMCWDDAVAELVSSLKAESEDKEEGPHLDSHGNPIDPYEEDQPF